jgi:NTE family protein
LTSCCLQSRLVVRVLRQLALHPTRLLGTKADDLSALLRKHWGVTSLLCDLPAHPRWMINATCYETGKNWRFERHRMGDYEFGYAANPRMLLSDALAASAGFPGLIGPLVLDTRTFSWFEYRHGPSSSDGKPPPYHTHSLHKARFRKVHLWDGGVYDNLGVEALHKHGRGWRDGVDFLIVSDASGSPGTAHYCPFRSLLRLTTGILMNQIRSLRSRAIMERITTPGGGSRGALLRMGNTAEEILRAAGRSELLTSPALEFMSGAVVRSLAGMRTQVTRLSPSDLDGLIQHGFEVADCTLHGYNSDVFGFLGRWSYR